ncbi:hypothetical protein [Pyrobaculum sp.]|uniref:hypothetical protein n=1 Tax=Pyrobaculum sp. TaxID=2004705 RepID=UPI00316A2F2C
MAIRPLASHDPRCRLATPGMETRLGLPAVVGENGLVRAALKKRGWKPAGIALRPIAKPLLPLYTCRYALAAFTAALTIDAATTNTCQPRHL